MKIGRNAPCPCGSGKKYKKCCLPKERAAAPSNSLYARRLSETFEKVMEKLIDYAVGVFGQEAIGVAMDEFLAMPDEEDEISREMLERAEVPFWPWFVFNWYYDPGEALMELPGPEGVTVAELYLEKKKKKLNALEKLFIENVNRTLYSFWQVLGTDKGRGIKLKDVFRGIVIDVVEDTASKYVETGDILFGRAVMVDKVGMLVGVGPALIPPSFKTEMINLRKVMAPGKGPVDDEVLYDWDMEIRELYFWIDHQLHTPPENVNTDGHRLESHRLVYEITCSVREAFDKLCGLSSAMTPEEMLADAGRDGKGRLARVWIDWDRPGNGTNKAFGNVILGRIVIDGRRLTAEVNSAERARILRQEIEARLGENARFKVDEIRNPGLPDGPGPAGESTGPPGAEEVLQIPGAREKLMEMLAGHWENWVDMELPALGGKSPRQAVKTADGREAVEALLTEAARGRGSDPLINEANREGVRRARELLGLKDS